MEWTPHAVQGLLADLRAHGKDFEDVEVKLGAGGVPELGRTLSAFGNMPSGGTIVVGFDENNGFAPVGVQDPGAMEQGIASTARNAVVPPVQVAFEEAVIDGATLVIVSVAGLPSHQRPCRFHGQAWLRQSDGDYQMSELEVQQTLALRERPRYDTRPVEGATPADLDPTLVANYIAAVRTTSRRLMNEPDDVVLKRRSVLTPDGSGPTVAGLYALGAYPQQFLPNMSITAAVLLDPRSGQRTRDLIHLDGPLPELLDSAVEWVERNTLTTTAFGEDGHGRDQPELPMVAVRELISNALVHRDLGPHTRTQRVEIRLRANELVITNPGGLYGVSLDQLDAGLGKSAVNESLYDICKFARTPSGNRVIEGEGGGIREVQRALRAANMRPPHFVDAGVRFTVVLPRHGLLDPADLAWLTENDPTAALTSVQRRIITSMRHGREWTNALVRDEFAPIDSRDARASLQGLVNMGLAVSRGERGGTTYLAAAEHAAPVDEQPVVTVHPPTSASMPAQGASPSVPASNERGWRPNTVNAATILEALADGPLTRDEILAATGLTARQVLYALTRLKESDHVVVDGGRGVRGTTYRVAPGRPLGSRP